MQNKTGHVLSWIGLSSIPGVGRVTFRKLVRHFGSAERSLAASPGELRDVEGLSFKVVETIGAFDWRRRRKRAWLSSRWTTLPIPAEAASPPAP